MRKLFGLFALILVPTFAGAQTWTATGSMTTARDHHTATLLPNGRVLVAGGSGDTSAEEYNRRKGLWSATGSMVTARTWHTATLLPSGKVLVAGGLGGAILASAELYDPATGTWTATGSMTTARGYHTATLLPSGKVLVAGGWSGITGVSLASAEVYDPATETWTATGSLSGGGRVSHTATLLPSGKVLAAGGWQGSGMYTTSSVASAEVYDPATETWTATGSLLAARENHTATLLPSGKVLVAGGSYGDNYTNYLLASAEVYDPATETWTATGSMTTTRLVHTATLLPSGKVLVAGGITDNSVYLASAEVYDPAAGTWTATGSMMTARAWHTATFLEKSGEVLVTGGWGGLASAELYY